MYLFLRRSTWLLDDGTIGKIQIFSAFRFKGQVIRVAFVLSHQVHVDEENLKFFDTNESEARCIYASSIREPLAYGLRLPDSPHRQYVLFPSSHLEDPDEQSRP